MRTKMKHVAELTSALIFAMALSFGATQSFAGERQKGQQDWCEIDCTQGCDCNEYCVRTGQGSMGICHMGGTCICGD